MDRWSDALDDFAARLERDGGRARALAPASRTAYLKDARQVAAWLAANGVLEPERTTTTALSAAFRGLDWSAASRSRALTALRLFFAPHFPPNRSPADLIDEPRPGAPPIPRLSQLDAARVVESAAAEPGATGVARALALRDRAILEVLYGSGLRRQEVCDAVLSGLDFEHETIRIVGKGARARTVPLTEPAVAALADWLAEGRPGLVGGTPVAGLEAGRAPVFVSRTGRKLDGSAVYRVARKALRESGRAGGPHLLRHAAGTHLLEGPPGATGAHLRVVQEILGHASLATTQRYTGVTTKAIQDALRKGHPRG
jgi:site-specific recombinase XerD